MSIAARSRYNYSMTTDTGALTPSYASPTAVADPQAVATHKFTRVLADLIRKSGVYHTEAELHAALEAVDEFARRHVDPSARHMLTREDDPAPVEDVSKRKPPAGAAPAAVPALPIDYNALAAAIVAHERAQNAPVVQDTQQ